MIFILLAYIVFPANGRSVKHLPASWRSRVLQMLETVMELTVIDVGGGRRNGTLAQRSFCVGNSLTDQV